MNTHNPPAPVEPLSYNVEDACRMIGIGRTSIYRLATEGKIRIIKVAGRSLVPADSLRALIATASN